MKIMSLFNSGIYNKQLMHFLNRTHQHICVLKVVPPVGADLALTSDIPNIQLKAR